jgi:predicted MFS family arabinose efflux permease
MNKTNKVLARIQLITSIGNHVGFFGVVYALYIITGSALKAGLLMAIQQLGHAFAAAIYPFLLTKLDPKRLIVLTQFLSLLILSLVFFLLRKINMNSVQLVYLFMTIIAFLDRIYLMATEYFSKTISDKDNSHREKQGQIISAFFGAQFWGPILSFILLKNFHYSLSILVDAISFIFAIISGISLHFTVLKEKMTTDISKSFIQKLKFIIKDMKLRKLLVTRSVFSFIPLGIFNIYIFDVISNDLKLGMEFMGLSYAVIGLSGSVGVALLRLIDKSDEVDESIFCAIGAICMALTLVPYLVLQNSTGALITAITFGFFMGSSTLASQSLRRKFTDSKYFPTFLSVELIFSMLTGAIVGKLCVYLSAQYGITSKLALLFSIPWYFILAILYLRLNIKIRKTAL